MELKEMIEMLKLPDDKVCLVINRTAAAMVADRLEEMEMQVEELKEVNKQFAAICVDPKEGRKPEWVSVEDEPVPQPFVTCYYKNDLPGVVAFCWMNGGGEITHWMRLDPPKPKEPTFKDVFLEKFPKATVDENGIPCACRDDVFGGGECNNDVSCCPYCWNQPCFEEEEKE